MKPSTWVTVASSTPLSWPVSGSASIGIRSGRSRTRKKPVNEKASIKIGTRASTEK